MGSKRLRLKDMLEGLKQSLAAIPEHRSGANKIYELADAGLAAFGVFFMQSPSFLAHQRDTQHWKGHNNAEGLFGVERIPSDGQIRNLLDPVEPTQLEEPFWTVYKGLEQEKYLEQHHGVGGTRLISLDGMQYFSSQKAHYDKCRVTEREEETYSPFSLASKLSPITFPLFCHI